MALDLGEYYILINLRPVRVHYTEYINWVANNKDSVIIDRTLKSKWFVVLQFLGKVRDNKYLYSISASHTKRDDDRKYYSETLGEAKKIYYNIVQSIARDNR